MFCSIVVLDTSVRKNITNTMWNQSHALKSFVCVMGCGWNLAFRDILKLKKPSSPDALLDGKLAWFD